MSESISWRGAASILAVQLAWFLALLALVSAGHKLSDPGRARRAARQLLPGLTEVLAALAVRVATLGEFAAALLLLLPSERMGGAALAAAIWTGYLVVLARAALAGRRDVDCGCSFGAARHALGRFELLRGAVLVGLAVSVAVTTRLGGGSVADGMDAARMAALGITAAALLVLYAALDQVMAQSPLRSGEVL
jgi:hypothetical protein